MHEGQQRSKTDAAIAVENMRRLFRRTMAETYALPGEPPEQTVRRLRSDPATLEVAKRLSSTVDELLQGLGEQEPFIVDVGYDHSRAVRTMDRIIDGVLEASIGLDDPSTQSDQVVRFTRNVGVKAAPHVAATRGRIDGDDSVRRQIQAGMRRRPEFHSKERQTRR